MNSNKISATPPMQKEEIIENPLSPVLNRKRYARKHINRKPYKRPTESPGTSALPKPQTSHIPIPVKDKTHPHVHKEHSLKYKEHTQVYKEQPHITHVHHHPHAIKTLQKDVHTTSSSSLTNFKQEVITKCGKIGAICKFETVVHPISISEGKLAKPDTKQHKESKSESESKVVHQIKGKPHRYPQVFSNNLEVRCASGDISQECNYNKSGDTTLCNANEDGNIYKSSKEQQPCVMNMDVKKTQMLYENSKFLNEYSKTTVNGSVDSVISPIKVFCNNNFHSTDSSVESPKSPRSPKCLKRYAASPLCIKEEDTDKEQVSQLNYNDTVDVSSVFQAGYDRQLQGNSQNLPSITSLKAERAISKNIVNVKITPSLKEEIDGWTKKVDKMTSYERTATIIENPFHGFSSEDIDNAEIVYQQYKNAYKAMLKKKKKTEFKMSPKESSSHLANDNETATNNMVAVNDNHSVENSNVDNRGESEKVEESIIPSAGNRVQICIGNNRIKINIKADNNIEIGKIDSSDSTVKTTDLTVLTSDVNKNNSWGDNTIEVSKKALTVGVETQADFGGCAVETQANFGKLKHASRVDQKADIVKQAFDRYKNVYDHETIEMRPDFSCFNNAKRPGDFGGFNTASGKSITLNKQKLSAANTYYNNIRLDQEVGTSHPSCESTDSKKNDEDYSTSGFKSGSGHQISSHKNDICKTEFLTIHVASNNKKDNLGPNGTTQKNTFGFEDSSCGYKTECGMSTSYKHGYDVSPTKVTSGNHHDDFKPKTLFIDDSTCGFRSASGNPIKLNQNYLNKVIKLYENINGRFDYSESDSKTSIDTLSKVTSYGRTEDTTPISPRSIELSEILPHDKLKIKGDTLGERQFLKPRSLIKKMEEVNRNELGSSTRKSLQFEDEIKHENIREFSNSLNLDLKAGFASAPEKKIRVDADKLKNASAKFYELGIPDTYENSAESSIAQKMNVDVKVGFSSASGRKIKIDADKLRHASAKFQDLEFPAIYENSAESSNAQKINFDFKPGFASASGKKIKIDLDKLENASAKFQDLEIPETLENSAESSNINKLNFDSRASFASASGKKINVSNEKVKNASAKYHNLDIPENILQDITDTAENKVHDNSMTSPAKTKYTERTAPELIKDVVNTYDKTILTFISPSNKCSPKDKDKNQDKDLTPVRSSISKKRLGMCRLTGVNAISKEKLEKARLLFEECDKNLTITPMKSFTNVKYNNTSTIATPRRDGSIRKIMTSTPIVPRNGDLRNLDITPIKNSVIYDNDLGSNATDQTNHQDTYEGTLLFRDKSASNFQELQNDIDTEYMHLKRKLEILEERKTALEEQKYIIDRCDYQHTRPRSGSLSINKQNCHQRIQLSDLINCEVQNFKHFKIDSRVFEINSRNADKIHFNAAKYEFKAVVQTLDGAKVIPNTRNTIGVTEINNAFQAMNGVDPKLIPKGWVLNHYKWIVWKLASYERRFPEHFKDYLCVDNIMQQLKYRYDIEIDQACRPALRKIMELDDIPNKRLVLCVADIIQIFNKKFELLLTDGWYAIRAVIDSLLCEQIYTNKLTIGTKLFIQGAELLNCEGCHPLEAPEHVKLKIGYNSTRRALWHIRLGYYKITIPFPISLRTIHPDGGQVARVKVYIVRVYPLRFMEEYNGIKIWRNCKAEEKRAMSFETDRMKELEKIKHKVYDDYEKSLALKPNHNQKVDKQQLGNVTCPKLLYQIMEGSKDPEGLYSLLNSKQKSLLMDYKTNIASERHRIIASKMTKQLEELKLSKRIVTPMLKLLVTDATEDNSKCMVLNVWRPNEEQMQMFQEERCMSVYNVMVKKTHELNSVRRTMFEIHEGTSTKRTRRQLLPISMTTDPYYKPLFNEFDTIGIIVDVQINNYDQEFWLADFVGRLLYVKIVDGPKSCSLIDNFKVGQSIALCNLVIHPPHSEFGQAVANQLTTISQFPKLKFLQTAMEIFNEQIHDLNKLIHCCKSKLELLRAHVNLKSNDSYQDMSFIYKSNANISMDSPSDENASIPSRLTEMDVAMSLLDTDQFF